MADMIKIYRMNTGSCGGCDAELDAAVFLNADLAWTSDPLEADVLVLTGPLTTASKPAFMATWQGLAEKVPLVAVGRCSIDGYPYGRGGLADNPDVQATIKIDGCPPEPAAIAAGLRESLHRPT